MAKVSITQAAKLAGIARSHLYKTYLDTGAISLSRDEKGKPCIDTSELLRVFGTLQDQQDTPQKTGQRTPLEDNTGQLEIPFEDRAATQEKTIRQLEQQLAEAKEREVWYQSQIHNLTDTMKRLEAPRQAHPVYPRRWWQFWK